MLLIRHIKYLFLLLILTISLVIPAQLPSHFIIGQEELSDVDIYHMIQDNDQNYWLATNQGIIKYDGYSFTKIECENTFSSSAFDLQIDYNNTIHFKNLSGQIFQIKNDSCFLRIQIPDSLMSLEVFYSFDNNNNLIVISNSIFKVTSDNDIEFFKTKNTKKLNYAYPIILKDSSIFVHCYKENNISFIKNDIIQTENLQHPDNNFVIQSFYHNNTLYHFDKRTGKLLNKDGKTFSINTNFNPTNNENEHLRYYSDNEHLWIARQGGGVKVFDKNLSPLFKNKTLFKNSIISSFYKDKEGNIILGTFGEGLIIITNLDLSEINLPDPNAKITRITSALNNTIFLGTQNGKIYTIDSTYQVDLFRNKQVKNIEVLEYFSETNELLINDRNSIFINLSTGKITSKNLESIKDVVKISNNKYLISSNVGVSYFYPDTLNRQELSGKVLPNFIGRTNAINYDPNTKTIYAGTSLGLKIGNDKEAHYFSYNNKPLICRDILYFEDQIYITTKKDGLLIFKNNQLIDHWTTKNHLYSNSTNLIKEYKNNLYITTNVGIQILNKKGETVNTLNKSDGLYSNKILDFEIKNDILWLVHSKGVQPIDINKIKPFNFTPKIILTQLLVNDSNINFSKKNKFNYLQSKFEFTVSAKNIRFSNEIKYHYQLEGIDKEWQINNYKDNKIKYKTLPPGDYTFKIKSVFRNNQSKVLTYSFTIKHPFWERWWFYALIALGFITITLFIFKLEMNKQRKKIQLKNELNASKLIAIQSQMNPHFIFNAINSIQDLILKGDIDNSYSYIIKFSKLVRQTLNFSDKEFIDIEAEIELLEIYLELEKLRFKGDFEYTINCNIEDIQVPPMLIQPFVENAIKHGLLHKEGIKKLTIEFNKNKFLTCTITDNGIGRKEAQRIKDRRQRNHQSFSVNATQSRFKIMKSHYQQDLGVKFEDLTENGSASGTKVIINMPFKPNY